MSLVSLGQFSDIGNKFTVDVDFVHPKVREGIMGCVIKNRFTSACDGIKIQTHPKSTRARYRHDAGGNVCAPRTGYHRNDVRVEQKCE